MSLHDEVNEVCRFLVLVESSRNGQANSLCSQVQSVF